MGLVISLLLSIFFPSSNLKNKTLKNTSTTDNNSSRITESTVTTGREKVDFSRHFNKTNQETEMSRNFKPNCNRPPAAVAALTAEEQQTIQELLTLSRQQIAEGRGKEALENVIRAIIANSGEGSVIRILDAANEQAKYEKEKEIRLQIQKCCNDLRNGDSLLCEYGDEDILIDAFQDGSSVICQRCQGLISVERAEAHSKRWCPALEHIDVEDLDDDDDDS